MIRCKSGLPAAIAAAKPLLHYVRAAVLVAALLLCYAVIAIQIVRYAAEAGVLP